MTLQEAIETKQEDVNSSEQITKVFYINELLRLDPLFDRDVRIAMAKSLKRGVTPCKKVTLSDFTTEELLDVLNPIDNVISTENYGN
ncbi:MAG: hypothetical protein WCP46_00445 [Alphaproteobacteria bacterium]